MHNGRICGFLAVLGSGEKYFLVLVYRTSWPEFLFNSLCGGDLQDLTQKASWTPEKWVKMHNKMAHFYQVAISCFGPVKNNVGIVSQKASLSFIL